MLKNILLISALFAFTNAEEAKVDQTTPEEKTETNIKSKRPVSIFEAMERLSKKLFEAFDSEFTRFDTRLKNKSTPAVDMKDEADHVLVTIKVTAPNENGVTVNAKKSKLRGELTTVDGTQFLFNVIDGKILSVRTQLNKQDKDKEKSYSTFASSSYRHSLSSKVTNLEETAMEIKDGILSLKLPKAESKWKKIAVVK